MPTAGALRELSVWWNGAGAGSAVGDAWAILASANDALRAHAAAWAHKARRAGDLAMKLAQFCAERLD